LSSQEKFNKIQELLELNYPIASTSLKFETDFELLVAAILSAQCTDKQVNQITGNLFKKYNTPQDFASLAPEELGKEIKGCGLYRNKSKYIIESSRAILKLHGGQVPGTRKELESLPGVGRKTAGVVLGVAFDGSALPVDTHVYRVARRLGLTSARDPGKVEDDLSGYIPPQNRMSVHHRLIAHGRTTCLARKPACESCFLKEHCQYPIQGGQDGGRP